MARGVRPTSRATAPIGRSSSGAPGGVVCGACSSMVMLQYAIYLPSTSIQYGDGRSLLRQRLLAATRGSARTSHWRIAHVRAGLRGERVACEEADQGRGEGVGLLGLEQMPGGGQCEWLGMGQPVQQEALALGEDGAAVGAGH